MKELIKTIASGVKNTLLNPKKSKKMMQATLMWQRAKEEADQMRSQDGHRYFVIYDASQDKLICITYDIYKNRGDSYQYLRQRGRFKRPLRREELKELCFYYTTSQWTSKACTGDEEREKLIEWQKYYLKVHP